MNPIRMLDDGGLVDLFALHASGAGHNGSRGLFRDFSFLLL
jgi:hypothetical protein